MRQTTPICALAIAGLAAISVPCLARDTLPPCISAIRIDHTEVVDDSTILFHMRDHTVYRNVLPERCVGLRTDTRGFTYAPSDNNDALCSNLVTIRLNTYQAVCQLGAFERIK